MTRGHHPAGLLPDERRAAHRCGVELLLTNPAGRRRALERETSSRALGTTRDRDYARYDANVKRRERQAAHEQITQWEMNHYLQLYQSGAGSP